MAGKGLNSDHYRQVLLYKGFQIGFYWANQPSESASGEGKATSSLVTMVSSCSSSPPRMSDQSCGVRGEVEWGRRKGAGSEGGVFTACVLTSAT